MEGVVRKSSTAALVRGVVHQYGVRMVLGELPRLFYGNDAGLWENYLARKELARIRAISPRPVPNQDADFLQSEGYLVLGTPFDSALIQRIADRFVALIEDESASRSIGPRLREASRAIVRPIDAIPEIRELLSPRIREILTAYYRAPFEVKHVRAWRNRAVSAEFARQDVYSNLWHNDHDPVTLLRLFVYLTDNVTRDTGATHFHPIPATKKIIRAGYLRRRAILPPARRILEDPARIRYFEGGAGSACLLNPQLCLHRAGVPRDGSWRDIIQFTLAPSPKPLGEKWADHLPPDPEALL